MNFAGELWSLCTREILVTKSIARSNVPYAWRSLHLRNAVIIV
jgi:hypothetical protein